MDGGNPLWLAALARAYADADRADEARDLLTGLSERAEDRFVSPFALALVHVGLGDADAALEALREARTRRDPYRIYLAQHPPHDPRRADRRFDALEPTRAR